MTLFMLFLASFYGYVTWVLLRYLRFQKKRDSIQWRVHINGIRGKSTVTRYVSAVFRAAGYHTFGKTTGSAARILRPTGEDFDFKRKGYPNVNEQVKMIEQFSRQKAEVVVLECMATNPLYAEWLEEKVMRSQIGVITNVRYDHPDQMGETLEEIAASLAKTTPQNGILITAETNPNLVKILEEKAAQKNCRLVVANRAQVNPEDLTGFTHFAIEDNIAIGLEIAKLLKVPRYRAIQAMQQAPADPGAFSIKFFQVENRSIAWANLFAVNDRESFIDLSHRLFKQYPEYTRVVILNNRHDRPTRVELFATISRDLDFDQVVTFGDYESVVNQILASSTTPVLNLGNSSSFKDASASTLLQQIIAEVDSKKILLIGTVNIHTAQAEKLLQFFEKQRISHSQVTSVTTSEAQITSFVRTA